MNLKIAANAQHMILLFLLLFIHAMMSETCRLLNPQVHYIDSDKSYLSAAQDDPWPHIYCSLQNALKFGTSVFHTRPMNWTINKTNNILPSFWRGHWLTCTVHMSEFRESILGYDIPILYAICVIGLWYNICQSL